MAERLTVFLGAFLLFSLELMAAKALLPRFGGSAQVWTAAMMFYQGLLLAGYLYARRVLARLGPARYARPHLLLLLTPLLFFPLAVSGSPGQAPLLGVIAALTLSIGVPFFVLSTTTPIVQTLAERSGQDAYHLFAASNLGSLAALIGYPILIEPFLTLKAQFVGWQALYGVYFLAFTLVPGSKVNRPGPSASAEPSSSWRERSAWVLLAAGPSAALLATTNLLSWDLASVPLLWVLPLALYLLSFVLVFKRTPWTPERVAPVLIGVMLLWLAFVFATVFHSSGLPERWQLARRLWVANKVLFVDAAFFLLALVAHGALARAKPAGRAPEFYSWVAAGGWAGSLLVAVLLPLLARDSAAIELDWAVAGGLSVAALFWAGRLRRAPGERPSRAAFAVLSLLALGAAGLYYKQARGAAEGTVFQRRGFYGIHRVSEADGLRRLFHGNTMHGAQSLNPARRGEPLLYYHRGSPGGEVFAAFGGSFASVGALGLGAGALAAYGRPGQAFDFYEIDPDVEAVARRWFSYLEDSRARVAVIPGDGRLSLEARRGAAYDLLVLDVFSGGTIPAHFLTREAFALYAARLKPGGLLLVHASNRFLDLRPLLAALGADGGWSGAAKEDPLTFGEADGRHASTWIVLARDGAGLKRLAVLGWRPLEAHARGLKPWTDGYANVWAALGG